MDLDVSYHGQNSNTIPLNQPVHLLRLHSVLLFLKRINQDVCVLEDKVYIFCFVQLFCLYVALKR